MNLVEVLKIQFPNADFRHDIILQDDGDGPYIKEWNLEQPRPTYEDLAVQADDRAVSSKFLQQQVEMYLRNLIENKPTERGYDNIATISSYVTSGNEQWQAEAQAFINWRDSVFEYAYNQLAIVQNEGDAPSLEDFIAGIPELVWP